MTTTQKNILLKLLSILLGFMFFGDCQTKENNSTEKTIRELHLKDRTLKQQDIDSVTFNNKVIDFLLKEQELIKNDQIEKIANHVKFPLDGGYVLSQVYGDEFLRVSDTNEAFSKVVDKEVFIKKYDSIFSPVFRSLFSEVDIDKKINDQLDTYQLIKEENNILWTIDFGKSFEHKTFQIYWRVVTDNWEKEFTVFFRYKYDGTSFILIQIDVIG